MEDTQDRMAALALHAEQETSRNLLARVRAPLAFLAHSWQRKVGQAAFVVRPFPILALAVPMPQTAPATRDIQVLTAAYRAELASSLRMACARNARRENSLA